MKKRFTRFAFILTMIVICLSLVACQTTPTLMFRNEDGNVYYKYSNETEWTLLFEQQEIEESPTVQIQTAQDGKIYWKYSNESTWQVLFDTNDLNLSINANSNLISAYEVAVEGGYQGTFLEYVAEVAEHNTNDNLATIHNCLRSAVIVQCADSASATEGSSGAGVIYKLNKEAGEAYILTNCHVVYESPYRMGSGSISQGGFYSYCEVYLYGSYEPIQAKIIGGLEDYDIAVVKIENSDIIRNSEAVSAKLTDDLHCYAGETIYAIGNPNADGIAITKGIVSVDSEYVDLASIKNLSGSNQYRVIRVDAPINPGNSGGGLFNNNGELIGVVNAKNTQNDNMGFALPIHSCVRIADRLIDAYQNEPISQLYRVSMGLLISVTNISAKYNQETGLCQVVQTVQVSEVQSGSASDGLLQAGDVLVSISINGTSYPIDFIDIPTELLWECETGDSVSLTILRGGNEQEVEISFGASNFSVFD